MFVLRRLPVLLIAAGMAAAPARADAGRGRAPAPAPTPDEPVARVGDRVITRGEIEALIQEQDPQVRRRYRKLDARRELVEDQVRLEVLAAEAERQGLLDDAEVRRVVRFALADRLIRKAQEAVAAPTDAELRAWYDAHRAEFVKPAERRIAEIALVPKRHGGKAKTAAIAQEILARIKQAPADNVAYRQLVDQYTDDAQGRLRGGASAYFARDDATVPESLRAGAFALADINDVSVVDDARGVHVIRLIGSRGPSERPLEAVRERVLHRVLRERREAAARDLESHVKQAQGASVRIDEAALRRVRPGEPPAPSRRRRTASRNP